MVMHAFIYAYRKVQDSFSCEVDDLIKILQY